MARAQGPPAVGVCSAHTLWALGSSTFLVAGGAVASRRILQQLPCGAEVVVFLAFPHPVPQLELWVQIIISSNPVMGDISDSGHLIARNAALTTKVLVGA